ncbi:MAG TPA: class I SAM-dependent methyltransferase [bacterium]|jgi:SAM-dependent methyltransferase|nr:class I SAM-dependent methyltransferase [bacterium]
MIDERLASQLAALDAGEFRFLRGKLLWSRIFPGFFRLAPSDVVLNAGVGQGPQVLTYGGACRLMVGVDVSEPSLRRSLTATRLCGITNYAAVCADAEALPFRDGVFDRILAVDIVSVVDHPDRLCDEMRRVLQSGGEMLMTFPGLQLRLRHLAARIGRTLRRFSGSAPRPSHRSRPRRLPRMAPLPEWLQLLAGHGFRLVRAEATSIVPPLHWLGLSRFWFRNEQIFAADRMISRMPAMQFLAQAVMAVFARRSAGPASEDVR